MVSKQTFLLDVTTPSGAGKVVGGVPITRGPLAYLLKNRMYLGELNHGSISYPGEHEPIVARDAFDAVQAKLGAQAAASGYQRLRSDALLTGKLFDQFGRPMTPSYAVKGGVRYRYSISRGMAESGEHGEATTFRVPAPDVEKAVVEALARADLLIQSPGSFETVRQEGEVRDVEAPQANGARKLLERVTVCSDGIEIRVSENATEAIRRDAIVVPWSKPPTRVQRDIIAPPEGQWRDPRAMSSDTRSRLLASIAAAEVGWTILQRDVWRTSKRLLPARSAALAPRLCCYHLPFLPQTSSRPLSTIACRTGSALLE